MFLGLHMQPMCNPNFNKCNHNLCECHPSLGEDHLLVYKVTLSAWKGDL